MDQLLEHTAGIPFYIQFIGRELSRFSYERIEA